MIDGVFPVGEDGQVHFAEAAALTPEDLAADAWHAPARSPARTLWAALLARIFEILPLRCALCGAQMRLIAFVTDPPVVKTMLAHLG